jgi:hypothetical protein
MKRKKLNKQQRQEKRELLANTYHEGFLQGAVIGEKIGYDKGWKDARRIFESKTN